MTLTDDEVRAIDEAARVLRRVAQEVEAHHGYNYATVDLRVYSSVGGTWDICDGNMTIADGDFEQQESPGEALRRLVGR